MTPPTWWDSPAGPASLTRGGPWPAAADYVNAMQNASSTLADPELRAGTVRTGMFGLPAVATGQNAAVFRVDARRSYAVRCFSSSPADGQARYATLADRLLDCPEDAFVDAVWLGRGVRVNGSWWPVVRMEWADGEPLHRWVEGHLNDPAVLRLTADRLRDVASGLVSAGIVHGDLQHGNVLAGGDGRLRLVDYDGVVVVDRSQPDRSLTPRPSEAGHPNYQHPQRIRTGHCDAWTDTFSALLINLSLQALAADPSLWRYHTGENLVFTAEDLELPGRTPIWRDLARSDDPECARDARILADLCGRDVRIRTTLDELLTDGVAPAGPPWQSERASDEAPAWWDPTVARAPRRTANTAWAPAPGAEMPSWPTVPLARIPAARGPAGPPPTRTGAWKRGSGLAVALAVLVTFIAGTAFLKRPASPATVTVPEFSPQFGVAGAAGRGGFAQPFSADLQGAVTQTSPDATGDITVTIEGTLSGGVVGRLRMVLSGPALDGGGLRMTRSSAAMGPPGAPNRYQGHVVQVAGSRLVLRLTGPGGQRIDTTVRLQIDQSTGSVAGTVVAGSSPSSAGTGGVGTN